LEPLDWNLHSVWRTEGRRLESTAKFVAMSQFTVVNGGEGGEGMTERVKQAFLDRPHLVDGAPGFVRMEVISPLDAPDEIWLLTYWTDEESFRTWHHSHLYRDSHAGIPKGLKLDPKATRIRYFEHVAS
jgi:heme-degrading monooxygenase HmoA